MNGPSKLTRRDRWQRSPADQGYILLFTLGVLAVISVLVLSMALTLRLDAQLVAKEKTRLQDEYALKGAVQYAVARLNLTALAQSQLAGKPPDPITRRKLWFPGEGPYAMQFAGAQMNVHLQDAGVLPDANLLTEQEWQRLFVELGVSNVEEAGAVAKAVVATKFRIARNMGSLGFSSVRELVNIQSLPLHVATGKGAQGRFGMPDLLVVGSELKQLDINRSPLVLFKVLGGFSDSQLSNLQLLRSRGPIAPTEGPKILAGSPAKLMSAGSDLLSVKIHFNDEGDSAGGLMVFALLKLENNTYKLIDQLIAQKY